QIAVRHLDGRLFGQVTGEQTALKGEGVGALSGVAARVVHADGGPAGEFLGEDQVVLLEGRGAFLPHEDGDAQGDAAGAQRGRHDGVDSVRLDRRGGRLVRGDPAGGV